MAGHYSQHQTLRYAADLQYTYIQCALWPFSVDTARDANNAH